VFPLRDPEPSKANEALRDVVKLKETVRALERRCEKQAAVLRAVCSLLIEKAGVLEPELLAAIARIENDRADQAESDCGQCLRALKPGSRKCLYCGFERPVLSVYELI